MVSYLIATILFVVYGVGFLLIYDYGCFIGGYVLRCIGIAMTCIGVFMRPFDSIMKPIGDIVASVGHVMVSLGDDLMARGRTRAPVNERVRNTLNSFRARLGGFRDASS